jgi:hypothetical protein
MVARVLLVLLLSGCGHFTKVENVYIDNSAQNNFIGNPCKFYMGLMGEQYCMTEVPKPRARNPDNLYKENK